MQRSVNDSWTSPLALEAEAMRRLGYRAVDALVRRWEELDAQPAWRGANRADIETWFDTPAPEGARPPERVLDDVLDRVLPLAGSVDHPRFFAFVPSAPTWPGVIADFLAAGFNTFQGTWLESAGPTRVELQVLDWFKDWIGYPEGASGVMTSGGSSANLTAIVAARSRAARNGRADETSSRDLAVYVSDQGHSSVAKAARIAGVGTVTALPSDCRFRMVPEVLADRIAADREAGIVPVAVVASGGTTNTGAVDPLAALADVCAEHDVWFHVDAAYGGFAFLTDRGRPWFDGMDRADSITLDPHKWLFQPYECGCLMVRDIGDLERAFRISPEYLQDAQLGREHVNFSDRGVQLTRSFRALKIWMSVQTFGLEAFREAIERAMELALEAERTIENHPNLELLSPAALGVVCYRVRPAHFRGTDAELDALNAEVQQHVIDSGLAMLSSTQIRERYALRLCILNPSTTADDVRRTLHAVVDAAGRASS